MKESYRRTNEPSPLDDERSTAGASGGHDLEVGRLFVQWAIKERLFSRFDDGDVSIALARAFAAGWEAGRGIISAH